MFRHFKLNNKRTVALLISALMLGLALVGTTLAIVISQTDKLTNQFVPARVSIEHSADGMGVVNDGDEAVYVRAAVIVTWTNVDQPNMLMSTTPVEGRDYEFVCSDGWVKAADGFWYYTTPIAPGEEVTAIASLTDKETAPVNYALSLELLLDGIQATPADAVLECFDSGVAAVAANGTLTVIPY